MDSIDTPSALKAARKQLGLTQERLAERIGYSLRMVKYMEAGERRITSRAEKLVQILLDSQPVKNPTR